MAARGDVVTADAASATSLLGSIVKPNDIRYGDGPGPVVRWTSLEQVKKGEDFYYVQPSCRNGNVEFGTFCVFDGHNGTAAALHAKEHLVKMVTEQLTDDSDRDRWLRSLPLAMAEAFLACNTSFAKRGETSGTTCTAAVVAGWTVTVAAVGDSRAILDTVAGGVQELSVDHRFDCSKDERQRVLQEGGMIARLRTFEGVEVGPLRSWPGGLCVSRSIGDIDCGPQITPLPHVRQVEVPRSGGRVIIASDGLWDALDSDKAASISRGLTPQKAASALVKESIKLKGLRDDITVLVIDLLPSNTPESDALACPVPKLPKEKKSLWKKIKVSTKKSKQPAPEPTKSAADDDLPNLVNDHDSIKGGNLYERYLQGGTGSSVHSGGAFCKVCGIQVEADSPEAEASVRAGNCFCKKHEAHVDGKASGS